VGIPAVVHVVAIVDVRHVNVVVVVPVFSPVFGPRVNRTDPVTVVLEAGISAYNQKWQAADSETVIRTKVSAVTILRNTVAVVAAALLPGAVVSVPVLRAVLPPCTLLHAMLLRRAPSALIAIASRLLGVFLPIIWLLPLRLLRALLRLLSLLLGVLLPIVRLLPLRLLRTLLRLLALLLGVFLPIVWLLPLRLLRTLLRRLPLLLGTLRLLSTLLSGLSLLGPALLLGGMALFFVLLLVLCIDRSSDSAQQRKNGCTNDSG